MMIEIDVLVLIGIIFFSAFDGIIIYRLLSNQVEG